MAAVGVLGGDPSKVDKVTVLSGSGPEAGIVFDLQNPDSTAIQVTSYNAHVADVMGFEWENNMAQMVRTGYHNEKGEVRARPGSPATIPLRVQQRNAMQSADLQQWTDVSNNVFSRIDAAGYAGLRVDAWVPLALETGIIQSGPVAPAVRLESAYGIVRMRGAIENQAGTGWSGGTTLATVPAGYRPSFDYRTITRQAGNQIELAVTTGGLLSSGSSTGTGGGTVIILNNIQWEVAP